MYSKQLSKSEIDELIEEMGHTQETRAEELDVPTLVKLGNKVFDSVKAKDGNAGLLEDQDVEGDDEADDGPQPEDACGGSNGDDV